MCIVVEKHVCLHIRVCLYMNQWVSIWAIVAIYSNHKCKPCPFDNDESSYNHCENQCKSCVPGTINYHSWLAGSLRPPKTITLDPTHWRLVIQKEAIFWANVDTILCHHMVKPGHYDLTSAIKRCFIDIVKFIWFWFIAVLDIANKQTKIYDKTILRHTAHTIKSWPIPKQWQMIHSFNLMRMIRLSTFTLTIITREMDKLKTHNSIYHLIFVPMCH